MSSHRKCPIPFTDAPRGQCRWCGDPILKGDKLYLKARWHKGCLQDYMLHTDRKAQLALLITLHQHCQSCKKILPQWTKDYEAWNENGRYWRIVRKVQAQVDHVIPLWKIVGMEPHAARKFFGPTNLQLLCGPCHTEKTSREAAERAHLKRLMKKSAPAKETHRSGPKSSIPKRKTAFQSRGFCKKYRRKMNGTTVVRKP